jgi:peptide deformylase
MPTYILGRPSRRLPELTDEVRRGKPLRITEYGEEILHRPCRPVTEYGDRHVGHAFNPRVETTPALVGTQPGTEGCLSVPGANAPLERPARAILHADDVNGRPFTLESTGYFARCLIHETQHLGGTVYVDHLSPTLRTDTLTRSADQRESVLARRTSRQNQLAELR